VQEVYPAKREVGSHRAVNACLVPVTYADHAHVTTIEGSDAILQEVQQRFASGFASQCGFCSPGMIMSLYTSLRNNPSATNEQLQWAIDGNLCRCTGYRPILDVARSLSSNCPCGESRLGGGGCCMGLEGAQRAPIAPAQFGEYILPPSLLTAKVQSGYTLCADGSTYVRPTTLSGLLGALAKFTDRAVLLGGCTGPSTLRSTVSAPAFISVLHVAELRSIETSASGLITLGSAVTLSDTQAFLESESVAFLPHSPLGSLRELLKWIGSTQVRSCATWGGCVALNEPNSDLMAFLCACDATVKLAAAASGKVHTASARSLMATGLPKGEFVVSVQVFLLSVFLFLFGLLWCLVLLSIHTTPLPPPKPVTFMLSVN
jgi:xanthine dehydrogenase iron-sulfur cluster and FAD-binding subunit A